jgi:TolB-like protein
LGKFESARDLYRGHFLAGFHASGVAPEFEQWVDVERDQLRRLASDASWRVALQCESSGRPADALTSARHAVELDPEDEKGVARLIALLDRQGDRSGALTVYAALERRLADGFSARPAPETRALMQALRQRPTPAARSRSFALDGPAPPVEAGRGTRRSRRPLIVAGAIGALITIVLVALLGPRAPPSGLIRNTQVVAVVPFRLHAPDSELGWLQDGMVELLTMRLSERDAFSVVEPGRVLAVLREQAPGQGGITSDKELRRLAEKVGAGRVVRGSLNGTREHLILAAWIITMPGGQTEAQASVEGPADSLPVLVDRLAAQLLGRNRAARGPPPPP